MSIVQKRGRGGYICVSDNLDKARHVKWAALDSGGMTNAKCDLTYLRGEGEVLWVPYWCSYIETPDAKIMIDTGLDLADTKERLSSWAKPGDIGQTPEQTVAKQLEKIGVYPDEIDIVIYTHLHFDHTGASRLFKKAKHIPQLAELRYAVKPDNFMESLYIQKEFIPLLDDFTPVDGDTMIVPGIYCFECPGHTPGSQAILVIPEKGQPWLLAGDACYLRENYENEWPPGIVWDPTEYVTSIRRQKEIITRLGAIHIPGHDPEVWKKMKKVPDWQYNDWT